MLNLFSLYLESSHARARYCRSYSIHMGKDLFGQWLVFTYFGLVGKKGASRQYAFQDIEEAQNCIQVILKKRINPPNPNCKPYQVKGFDIDSLKAPLPLSLIAFLPPLS